MAETIIIEEEAGNERIRLVEVAQKTIHLGLGAAAMAQDEIMAMFEKAQSKFNGLIEQTQTDATEFVDKAVDRGTTLETDGRERVNGFVEERKKSVTKVQDTLETQIERVLHRMNVPTRNDIEKLEEKLNTLSKKLNDLAK